MSSFLEACDVRDALDLAVRGLTPADDGLRRLQQPFALIGRDPRADISLDHRLVSRRHVYLQVVEGVGFWIDLDSRSGTASEGQLRKSGWLDAETSIRIGPFEIRRLQGASGGGDGGGVPGPRVSPLLSRTHAERPLSEVSLEFLNGPSRAAVWPMNRVMSLVGSASGCKFRLADPSVSSFHCSLVRTPLGLWAVDLLAPDGIAVNDARVRFAAIADGDVLRIGRYRIRLRVRSAGRRPVGDGDGRGPARLGLGLGSEVRPRAGLRLEAQVPARSEPPRDRLPAPIPDVQPSSIAWVSAAPLDLGRGDIDQSVLMPLVNQFGAMQQQMLDQFQQAVSMLVQMFGNLHRDQMKTIREELDQLKDLTAEVQAIKIELAARASAVPPAGQPPAESRRASAPDPASLDEAAGDKLDDLNPIAARIGPAAAAALPDPPPPGPATPPEPIPAPSVAASVAGTPRAPAPPRPRPAAAAADEGVNQDVILWLHQRMSTLQQERETRWQKILKLLPGAS
ncbi:FHA domain-containing protein [Aquisphaera insulae]|uniref:FHA domain-containing protein n=1 Tax=Aquisphaera insulae TaxID=2712864 RepID=UPI0013EB0AE2|nr:FHA domain-containing protein [Aquisphaera insulae]